MPTGVAIGIPPFRLSGTVYGTLMNHPGSLDALGDAVNQAPYKAPPRAPVLYLKPRNALIAPGDAPRIPAGAGGLEVGAALGIIIGRTACRVPIDEAADVIAGYTVVADLCIPHSRFYRPSVRLRAPDDSLAIASAAAPRSAVADPDTLAITVWIDGSVAQRASTAGMHRPVARLLADVTEFMTLQPGDLLLLGLCPGAPAVSAGQRVSIEIEQVGRLDLPPALAEIMGEAEAG